MKIITHVNKTYMRQALQAYFESPQGGAIRVDMNETRINLSVSIRDRLVLDVLLRTASGSMPAVPASSLKKSSILSPLTKTDCKPLHRTPHTTRQGRQRQHQDGDGPPEPQGTLTRAEFATMLYLHRRYAPAETGESTYSDVKTGDWYYNAVVWATEAGVVNGMGDGTFAPNDNITRQEMATMLYRLAKAEKVEEDKLASFPDAESVADWAKDAMNWAVSTEIVNGSTHDDKVNYLDPTATALRCQAAAVACRYLALSK